MTQHIHVTCEYCYTEADFVDEDPVEDGWFRLTTIGDEGPKEWDYCSTECLIAHL